MSSPNYGGLPAEQAKDVFNGRTDLATKPLNSDEEIGEPTILTDDSSEEPDEDEEEARDLRENFIADDDEEEEVESDEEQRKRPKKKRKRKHREEDLEEEDLELLEENTGQRVRRKNRLTRLRRGRVSESSEEDEDREPIRRIEEEFSEGDDINEPPQVSANIWDDTGKEMEYDDDISDFIDDDLDMGAGAGLGEEELEIRRKAKIKEKEERRKALSRPDMVGIDATAWDEIYEVFGDGGDYDWALEEDDAMTADDIAQKAETKYQDVFEPSEIRSRLLTEDDDWIRARDIPERMQLVNSSLSESATMAEVTSFDRSELSAASEWVALRISRRTEAEFFRPHSKYFNLLFELVKAVRTCLEYLLCQHLEVPYIYAHRRDYITYFDPTGARGSVELLQRDELWKVYTLGQKFRALVNRRKQLESAYDKLGVVDEYFEKDVRPAMDSIEVVADTTEWLGMLYKDQKADAHALHFHDDIETEERKIKLPSRISAYEIAKKTPVVRLANDFGLAPRDIVLNFFADRKRIFPEDPDLPPSVYAEQYTNIDGTRGLPVDDVLKRARMIIATELGRDPLLRKEMRSRFKDAGLITVVPTERGITKIDDHHKYHNFKYLKDKPMSDMTEGPQFLHILAAEAEHLATVDIHLSAEKVHEFEQRLIDAYSSDSYSGAAKAWNDQRAEVVREALEKYLIPAGSKWSREWLREEVEDFLAASSAEILEERVNVRPYSSPQMEPGQIPAVLAMSWGKGDPQIDAIALVFMDDAGRLREHLKLDNLSDKDCIKEFEELLERRSPDVIVVGGFSIHTSKLYAKIKEYLAGPSNEDQGSITNGSGAGKITTGNGDTGQDSLSLAPFGTKKRDIPVIYVHDHSARIYQHSRRAAEELSALSQTARYCVGLARYTQSPLNEYAALGRDIAAITFDEDNQQLIPKEKLLFALERAMVNVVNAAGVDINKAVNNPYYQHLLPYVSGLGPRKAQVLIKKIIKLGGTLVNREQFVKNQLLTTNIYINAAGFLRIKQESDLRSLRKQDVSEAGDPLDDTRVHPEDYELARKMATDALEYDEEDVHDNHPSHVVSEIMRDKNNVSKLDELNLDDFALNMLETNEERKRHTLDVIKEELLKPFRDIGEDFQLPTPWDVLTMLTGETSRTLRVGLIISAIVVRPHKSWVVVRLDSGIEGIINAKYLSDQPDVQPDRVVSKGQTLQGVIIQVNIDQFQVELSSRPSDVKEGDTTFRRVKIDQDYYDISKAQKDQELLERRKRREVEQSRRVIKHPDFHNLNSKQAEDYLAKQQRGDVVIRPSSKGMNHIAVTWKVDDGLYQHIDVVDENADPNMHTVGNCLVVDNGRTKQTFSDLDELIVNYVKAMARKTEELMAHEKFKAGSEDDLHAHLKNFVQMNPNKSAYAFGLNRKKPGHFNLCFLANKSSVIQTWPVRVSNESYFLFDTEVPTVPSLCDAFKYRHIHESQNAAAGGSKTPYGARTPGGRTPALGRTPGHVTPGRQSVRVPPPPPPTAYNQVHPSRAAMIQNAPSAWSSQPSTHW